MLSILKIKIIKGKIIPKLEIYFNSALMIFSAGIGVLPPPTAAQHRAEAREVALAGGCWQRLTSASAVGATARRCAGNQLQVPPL